MPTRDIGPPTRGFLTLTDDHVRDDHIRDDHIRDDHIRDGHIRDESLMTASA